MHRLLFWQMAVNSQMDTILRALAEGLKNFESLLVLEKQNGQRFKHHKSIFVAFCSIAFENDSSVWYLVLV